MGGARSPGKGETKHQILLVDDHPILREGLSQLINQEPDLHTCGETDCINETLDLINKLRPDLIVVDISLQGANGIELIKQIKNQNPTVHILTLSVHDEVLYGERALRAGAQGYVMKQASTDEVISAIRTVLRGGRYLSRRMQDTMLDKATTGASGLPIEQLSDRELEVFQLIGAGLGTRQIARRLHLSIKTIETYRAHIKEKLKLRTGMQLVRLAVEMVSQRSREGLT